MNRVLVTGGAGFIGSHLVEALHPHVKYLAVLDDLSTGRESNIPGARLWVGDVADPAIVEEACLEAKPDTIFHFAAQTSVRESIHDMVHDAKVNVLGTVNVLRAANRHASRIIYASTGGAMYGECARPATETNTVRSIAPYAVSKYSGEAYLAAANRYLAYRNSRRSEPVGGHVMLRFANVYGPRQDPHGEAGVVAIFLDALLRDEPMQIFGDGTQTRDFVYVGDAVAAALTCAQHAELAGVFNVGTGTPTRIDGLARAVASTVGSTSDPEYASARPGELQRTVLDSTKLREATLWHPRTPLLQGLALTHDWMRTRRTAD